jgi:uncharacterized SAM-dependent methyltransferase
LSYRAICKNYKKVMCTSGWCAHYKKPDVYIRADQCGKRCLVFIGSRPTGHIFACLATRGLCVLPESMKWINL